MDSFQTFCLTCFMLGVLCLVAFGYVSVFGIPNFNNIEEQMVFCHENGGNSLEPHRENYNEALCVFFYNNTAIEYIAREITNEQWAEHFGKNVGDYCFSCWDDFSCGHPHGEILRGKGVHC